MVDFTPASGNVAEGQVVLLGNTAGLTCIVTHLPIVNTVLGSAAAGGGVYEVVNLNNSINGAKVYWENTAKKITSVSTNNALFGFIVEAGGGGANTICRALHFPYV